jgi:hypothetical protein
MPKSTTFEISRDNGRDVRFTGELVATVRSSPERSSPDYSNEVGRWTKLSLYRTDVLTYVCQRIHCTQWQGEQDTHAVEICKTSAGVIEFFGDGRLAKALYAAAELDASVEIA